MSDEEAHAQAAMEAESEESRLRDLAEGEYIGDGVYASFDGYQVWLKARRDGMEHSVALEPDVLICFLKYVRHFYPTYGKDQP